MVNSSPFEAPFLGSTAILDFHNYVLESPYAMKAKSVGPVRSQPGQPFMINNQGQRDVFAL
jgi:hypothetical protein